MVIDARFSSGSLPLSPFPQTAVEQQRGVVGHLDAQEKLEHVSLAKSEVDKTKGETLEEISTMVDQLTGAIESKKTALAPLIKDLRTLRGEHQTLEVRMVDKGVWCTSAEHSFSPHPQAEFQQKKAAYEAQETALGATKSREEQEVSAYREETAIEESRYHLLQTMMKQLMAQVNWGTEGGGRWCSSF